MTTRAELLDGWLPIRLYWQQSQPLVDWCHFGNRRLTEPFFDQTVESCLRHPFNLLFRHQTPLELLAERHAMRPGLKPSGFIFHVSRCGSTLVSQMLAALPRTVVVSEAGVLDSVLRAEFRASGVTDEVKIEWLRWVVSALGQPRAGDEERFFIKFDSWNAIHLPLIRRAFPGVPWVFLNRRPVEVVVSQLNRRGAHMIPGVLEPQLLRLNLAELFQLTPEEYCARVLARVCEAALENCRDERALLVNYRQLPEAVWSSILDFFRLDYSATDVEELKRVSQFNAKNPALTFEADVAEKNRAATEPVKEATRKWVSHLYEQLEAAREAKGT